MWVRLGSTDLMAGKVMFLRSNQGGRFDGNESVADSFRSDLVNFKSSCTTILGAFYSFFVCQKKPPLSGSSPATRVMEIIGPKFRTLYGMSAHIGWNVGYLSLPALAWLLGDWFWIQLIISVPSIVLLSSYCVVPARISSQSSRHYWRSLLPHASALIQRDFGCVLGVQQTKQLPHIAKVDLMWQLEV
ncbi:hypothetical protein TNCV_2796121 [Trichonephila clavipes]|nr:hypothetical protein TNCV_2796121 [Trichonephila clavipes]